GIRHFLEDELGLPCNFAVARKPGAKTDNAETRRLVHEKTPLVLFGSYNERIYLAECGGGGMMKTSFVPASFPLPIVRRHTGTPFMGYSGATYIVQEFCNSLFDALFHILPLGSELDRVDATLSRLDARDAKECDWDDDANRLLDDLVDAEPVLVQISAAKRLRDRAEREARRTGDARVTAECVLRARETLRQGEPA
ncbi:MAG: chlorophyllide reductase subunit Z, partial [Gammaproteobacteria bacterium]|nr:chlorophyllide reductase subunit Z [Gammaproteobacteria bacterium]